MERNALQDIVNVPAKNGPAGKALDSRVENLGSNPDMRDFYYMYYTLITLISSSNIGIYYFSR